jgi:hypothetical protein
MSEIKVKVELVCNIKAFNMNIVLSAFFFILVVDLDGSSLYWFEV